MTTWCGKLFAAISMWFSMTFAAQALEFDSSFDFDFRLNFDLVESRNIAAANDLVTLDSEPLGGGSQVASPSTFTSPTPSVLNLQTAPSPGVATEPVAPAPVTTTTRPSLSTFSLDRDSEFVFRRFTGETSTARSFSQAPASTLAPTAPTTTVAPTTAPTPITITTPPAAPTASPVTRSTSFTSTFEPDLFSLNFNFSLLNFNFLNLRTVSTTEPPVLLEPDDLEFDLEPDTSVINDPETEAAQSLTFASQSGAEISPDQSSGEGETLEVDCTTDCPAPGDKVPEPGVLLLLVFGLAGIMTAGYRQKLLVSDTTRPSI